MIEVNKICLHSLNIGNEIWRKKKLFSFFHKKKWCILWNIKFCPRKILINKYIFKTFKHKHIPCYKFKAHNVIYNINLYIFQYILNIPGKILEIWRFWIRNSFQVCSENSVGHFLRKQLTFSCKYQIHIHESVPNTPLTNVIVLRRHKNSQKQTPEVFYKEGVFKNFAKLTGKHLCRNLFFEKFASFMSSTLSKKKDFSRGVFV